MQYTQLGEGANAEHHSNHGKQKQSSSSYLISEQDATSSQRSRPFSTVSLSSRRTSTLNPELQEPLTGGGASSVSKESDPFYVFREDLYHKLDLVDDGLTEYLRLVHQTDTATTTRARDAKKQLKRHIRNAESTLKDVETTISVVESQRDAFAHITSSELYERKALVTTSQDRLARCKADMNSDAVKQKLMQDERQKIQQRANTRNNNNDDDDDVENAAYMADSQAQTSLLMQQQDETLDELGDAVVRVSQMADHIHNEIGHQNKLLDEMDDDLQDAEEKLGMVMGKLAKFLKTKDKWQLGTIVILFLIVLVLFFLVLTW